MFISNLEHSRLQHAEEQTRAVGLENLDTMPESEYSEDDFVDTISLRERLDAWFDSSAPKGVIMCSSSYSNSPNPALEIKGAGTVGLPLSSRDADAIKEASHPGPFGKGSETIVDESIRKTWEINACDVNLRNPQWAQWVQNSVLPMCAEQLGLSLETRPFVHAELYKLLLYEEGAHFKPHRDSEKAPGMFATLAICLPSQFEGGDLVLEFGEERLVWNSSPSSFVDVSVAAWYADVTHEVKSITQGHRLVLTYNVINTQPALVKLPTASSFTRSDRDLAQIFKCWNEAATTPDFLCHFLDHKYTQDSIRMSRLVGGDQSLLHQVIRAAERPAFALFLATFEYMLHGGCDDYASAGIHEQYGTHTKLQKMVDLEGNTVATDVDIDKDQIVQDVDFASEEPDDEDFQGHTGNAGAEKTLWYRKVVLVMMPKSRWTSFIAKRVIEGSVSGVYATRQLLESYKKDTSNLLARANLQAYCETVATEMLDGSANKARQLSYRRYRATAGGKYSHELKVLLISCGVWLGNEKLCERILSTMVGHVPSDMFNDLREPIKADFAKFRQLLLDAFCQMGSITGVWKCLRDFLGSEDTSTELTEWSTAVLISVLQTTSEMTSVDAHTLMSMSSHYGTYFHNTYIVPCALKYASQAWFSLAFAKELFDHRDTGTKSIALDGADLQKDAINIVTTSYGCGTEFQVAQLGDVAKDSRIYTHWRAEPDPTMMGDGFDSNGTPFGEARILRFVDPTMLVGLYHHLAQHKGTGLNKSLLRRILESTESLGFKAPSLWLKVPLPFVLQLLSSVRDNDGPDDEAINAGIYANSRSLLTWILHYFVRRMPSDASLAMKPVGCNCKDCSELNRFLSDGQQRQLKYPATKARRQHLHTQLDRYHSGEVTHETLRAGMPQPLVVTKRPGARAYREREIWTKRAASVKEALLSIPEETLKKTLNAKFLQVLPEATMQTMLGDAIEGFRRMHPVETATTTAEDTLEHQIPAPIPEEQRDPVAERRRRVMEFVQSQMREGNGPPPAPLIPAKRKAEIDVVDLTED